jgi:hypothetical protein
MWGWLENTSCQGPEHAHIDIIKTVAHLTNNKDVFLCILHHHCRRGFLQQYKQMLEDMVDQGDTSESQKVAMDHEKIASILNEDRNFSIACELGLLYPTLKAMINHADLNLRIAVSLPFQHFIYMVYTIHMLCVYVHYIVSNMCLFIQSASCAPNLDVMLLKQQVFIASGPDIRQQGTFQYAFRRSHPLLQFLPQKLSEWIAKNLADELALPPNTGPGNNWSSADLNHILVADKKGNNLHT